MPRLEGTVCKGGSGGVSGNSLIVGIGVGKNPLIDVEIVGSAVPVGLACDAGAAVCQASRSDAFASRLAPT